MMIKKIVIGLRPVYKEPRPVTQKLDTQICMIARTRPEQEVFSDSWPSISIE